MSQASFILQLIDRISGPARAAAKSLREIKGAADSVQARQREAIDTHVRVAQGMRKQKKETDDLGGALGMLKGRMLGVAAAVGATALATNFVEGVFGATRFKEDTEAALATLLKSREAARDTMAKARKIAGDLALDPRETLKGFTELVGKGFKVSEIERITKSMADLKVVSPDVDPSRIIGGLSKIKATGYLQGDELNILVEAGVDANRIYGALAQILGKNVEEVQKLKQAGKIKAGDAIEAVMRAVNQTAGGGDPGALAAKRATSTLSGAIDTIKSRWESMILDINTGPAGNGIPFLRGVGDMLDQSTERGSRLKAALDSAFGAITGGISEILGGHGDNFLDTIVGGVETFSGIVQAVMPGITAFFQGFLGAIFGAGPGVQSLSASFQEWATTIFGNKDALEMLGRTLAQDFVDGIRSAASAASTAVTVLRALAPLFTLLAQVANAFSAASTGITNAVNGAATAISGLFTQVVGMGVGEILSWAAGLGTSLAQGIADGVSSGAAMVINAVKDLANSTINAAKDTLGIKSPSKVGKSVGHNWNQGIAVGIFENRAPIRAAEAVADGLISASGGVGGGPSVGAGSGGVAGNGGAFIGTLVINNSTEPEKTAELVRREISRLLEEQAVRE